MSGKNSSKNKSRNRVTAELVPWTLHQARKAKTKVTHYYTRLAFPMLVFLGSVILILNVAYSQWISPIYYALVDGSRQAAEAYLLSIKRQPQFTGELLRLEKKFGPDLRSVVFRNEIIHQSQISRLEKLLEQNSRSRDVLYGLSLLYRADGKTEKADQYLKLAREVDPLVGK